MRLYTHESSKVAIDISAAFSGVELSSHQPVGCGIYTHRTSRLWSKHRYFHVKVTT